jgi:hypothetical protein
LLQARRDIDSIAGNQKILALRRRIAWCGNLAGMMND